MRTCFAFLSVAMAALGQAQDLRFWLAYSDKAWAEQNGAKVGDELKLKSNVTGRTQIKFKLMVSEVAGKGATYGAGGTMLAFDTAVTGAKNYANKAAFDAARRDKILDFLSVAWYKGPPGCYEPCDHFDIAPLGSMAYCGIAGAGETLRPIGIWQAYGFGTAQNLFIDSMSTQFLGEFSMIVDTNRLWRLPGQTYGDDADEAGIFLPSLGFSAANRFNYLGATSGTGKGPSMKYAFTAVPEPTTALTLAAGLGLLRRRSRLG